ncbi:MULTISPECIES: AraC family transcriptional regulator [unclassified Pseudomonas]|uniref:AraC family transcriptional regulator n=1 Tax=unclassified Pseudomonas TaxID=196821 RepID=UPI001913283E|nr:MULTISPECIES: AraC family transcriptional regulator [unclassified Pseudomonas]MBK5373677.1 AraC family transcriptional regulator [Pseudomonas sp. TH43]MBK5512458.1 AraC family transcriptional regulator [Pseudomonas sp. TH15]
MRPATSSAAFVNHVLDVAERHGCDGDWLLNQIGLAREQLADSMLRVPMRHVRALLDLTARVSNLAHFGLLVGAAVRPGTYGALGYVLMTSPTLGESMNMILRFGKIVYDCPSSQTRIVISDGRVTLEHQRISELEPYCALHQEALLVGWAAFGRWLIASNAPMLEVRMMHSPIGDTALYEHFFGCPVQFDAGSNALVFAESLLSSRIHGADPRAHRNMLLEADWQMCLAYPALTATDRLRALLTEQLPSGDFSLKSLASQLAISPRTLQRKLAVEGENFNQVLENLRMELADHYLRRTDSSIMDIALLLGFSQASSFSHAFRQAHGISPAEYRKTLRAKPNTTAARVDMDRQSRA